MLEWINSIATGITIGSGAISVQSLIGGYTLAKKVDLIARRLETLDGRIVLINSNLSKIDEGFYSNNSRSIWISSESGLALPSPKLILPNKEMIIDSGMNVSGAKLISDVSVEAPRGFYREFIGEPAHFLHAVQPLNSGMPDLAVLRDQTLVPWHFKKEGIDYVGFIKKGYLKSYLGVEYKPAILNDRARFAFENPYNGTEMSRNDPCYCGSGDRYKHCCGSLIDR